MKILIAIILVAAWLFDFIAFQTMLNIFLVLCISDLGASMSELDVRINRLYSRMSDRDDNPYRDHAERHFGEDDE